MQAIQYKDWDGSLPAIVIDMPIEAYHNHKSISNSGLNLVSRSPAHYAFATPWKSTRAQEIGTAFHTALLEPERFKKEYMAVSADDRRVVEYKEAAKVYGSDKTLTASENQSTQVMLESIQSNDAARAVFALAGQAELSIFVKDAETGVTMRCRFDWLTDCGHAVDLKKTQDCREFSFARSMYNYRYHVQAAMYSDIYQIAFGKPLQTVRILAVEENPPCANVLYDIDALAMQYGHKQYREALSAYAESEASGVWSCYTGSGILTLPEYALNLLEENEREIY